MNLWIQRGKRKLGEGRKFQTKGNKMQDADDADNED